jgi:hypothetical protein
VFDGVLFRWNKPTKQRRLVDEIAFIVPRKPLKQTHDNHGETINPSGFGHPAEVVRQLLHEAAFLRRNVNLLTSVCSEMN